jgi:hypothetical protein
MLELAIAFLRNVMLSTAVSTPSISLTAHTEFFPPDPPAASHREQFIRDLYKSAHNAWRNKQWDNDSVWPFGVTQRF